MKMLSKVLLLTLCVTAMAFGAIIDDFNTDFGPASDNDPTIGVITFGKLIVDKTAGANTNFVDANITGGEFTLSTGTGTVGLGGAVYTGLWDLTAAGTTIAIDMTFKDLAGGSVEFWVSDDGGTNRATYTSLMPDTFPATISALVAGFTGTVDLVNVDAIGFTIFASAGNQDMSFDNFREYVVPEPGTYAMMAAGLLGLFAIRRKRA